MKILIDDQMFGGVTYALEQYEGYVHLRVEDSHEGQPLALTLTVDTARALAGILVYLASETEAGR